MVGVAVPGGATERKDAARGGVVIDTVGVLGGKQMGEAQVPENDGELMVTEPALFGRGVNGVEKSNRFVDATQLQVPDSEDTAQAGRLDRIVERCLQLRLHGGRGTGTVVLVGPQAHLATHLFELPPHRHLDVARLGRGRHGLGLTANRHGSQARHAEDHEMVPEVFHQPETISLGANDHPDVTGPCLAMSIVIGVPSAGLAAR